jgi:hypothetical protein
VVERAQSFTGLLQRWEARVIWMELDERELAEQLGLLRDDLSIDLDALVSSTIDRCFELKRLPAPVLPLQPNVKVFSSETDELSAAMTSRRAAEGEKSHCLEEVGFPCPFRPKKILIWGETSSSIFSKLRKFRSLTRVSLTGSPAESA